jgi:hypothetical protein
MDVVNHKKAPPTWGFNFLRHRQSRHRLFSLLNHQHFLGGGKLASSHTVEVYTATD